MKTILLASALLLIFLIPASAQHEGKISGKISSSTASTVPEYKNATIALLRAKDSVAIKFTAANREGQFVFENVANGKYFISITYIGYRKYRSGIIDIAPGKVLVELPAIDLVPDNKTLAQVTVTARRPLIEHKIDRTIVNVEASVTNIGTTALEVLEKLPGVTVDKDGNISLKGKDGVMILIDGRPTHLGGTDLANLLRNMPSSQMDQIEIMTNPPARFDADGNAGVINIRTKKNKTVGYNGSATASYTQGRYPKANEGFNLNYRNAKLNLSANLSHNYRKGFETLTIQRTFRGTDPATQFRYFDQESNTILEGNGYNARTSLDYFVSKRTTLGIGLSAATSSVAVERHNQTMISTPSKELESITQAVSDNASRWSNISPNLSFRTVFDSAGRELSADINYTNFNSKNNQFLVNAYFDADGNVLQKADSLVGLLPQEIDIYSGRVDYYHPINKRSTFEAGFKLSSVRTDNNAAYDSINNGVIVRDVNRSNHFVYRENVHAAYVSLSTALSKKWSTQVGLRLENTHAKGVQLTTGETFDRNYTQLFPTVYFQYKANPKNNFGLNYGRRIRRPNYESLNPFIRFIDRYTYSQGNPGLQPQLSDNIELTHIYKNFLTTTFNYSHTRDIIQQVIEQQGQETYARPANIASLRQYGLAVSINKPFTKWWMNSLTVNVYNNTFKGLVNNEPISFSQTTVLLNGLQQFKLSKTLTAEISGIYRSAGVQGVMHLAARGMLTAGLSKQVMKNNGTIRISVRDILYTQRGNAKINYGNTDVSFQEVNDTRVFAVGFTYRFSKGKIGPQKKRPINSASEEQERIDMQ